MTQIIMVFIRSIKCRKGKNEQPCLCRGGERLVAVSLSIESSASIHCLSGRRKPSQRLLLNESAAAQSIFGSLARRIRVDATTAVCGLWVIWCALIASAELLPLKLHDELASRFAVEFRRAVTAIRLEREFGVTNEWFSIVPNPLGTPWSDHVDWLGGMELGLLGAWAFVGGRVLGRLQGCRHAD